MIEQLAPEVSVLGQLLDCPKSPVRYMDVIFSGAFPSLVRVRTCCALVLPTSWLPKAWTAGDRLTKVPVPVSGIACGLPAALSATFSVALRTPVAAGVNVTLSEQEFWG
jgi:hypothetical protein